MLILLEFLHLSSWEEKLSRNEPTAVVKCMQTGFQVLSTIASNAHNKQSRFYGFAILN